MESDLVHLDPNSIRVHPVIEQLEKAGIFSYKPVEMDRLLDSVRSDGFLQPILVMPDGNGGYWRIAGKMRVEAAKALKCSVPAYVRHFPDEQSVISAAKAENFRRRLWDATRVLKEEEAIEKFLSRWTKKRADNVRKLHPLLLELCKQGVLRHRTDEDLIEDLKNLSFETQEAIAETFDEVLKAKITNNNHEENREELKNIMLKYKELEDRYREDTQKLNREISRLKILMEQGSKDNQDSEVIRSWEAEVKRLKTELYEKEAELKNLKNELYDALTAQSSPSEELLNQRAKLIHDATDKLSNDLEGGLKAYLSYITESINDLSEDTLIILDDKLKKIWKSVETTQRQITDLILQKLETLESEKEVSNFR